MFQLLFKFLGTDASGHGDEGGFRNEFEVERCLEEEQVYQLGLVSLKVAVLPEFVLNPILLNSLKIEQFELFFKSKILAAAKVL